MTKPARAIALQILNAVLGRQRPLDEVLAKDRDLARLEPRDRAFARQLVATTLRRLGQADALIDACLDRPLKPGMTELRNILRLGAVQVVFLQVPDHAAVGATVDLARGARLNPFKSLVNAVLRRLSREGRDLAEDQDAARLNTPDWLWQSWSGAYGEHRARAIALAHLPDPPLDLTAHSDPQGWAWRLDAQLLPTGTLRLPPGAGNVTALAGYDEGAWWVQDAAAALPAKLLGAVEGRRVVDLCAAPGGKTGQLAAAGARVTAIDRSTARVALLRENLARLRLEAEAVIADAAAWRPSEPAEAVLLDAPCSATGTLRRHPDIARLKRPEEVVKLAGVQDRLLAAAAEMLAPGGILVYAVCSLQLEEGPERVAALLDRGAPLERVPIGQEEIGGLAEAITAEGDLRTLPCFWAEWGGMDGFYACRLRRKPS